jgi:trehalose 6-phosphate phosphatase
VLARLAQRLARVAVVSGRPADFVRRHIPDRSITVVGHYGLERDDGTGVTSDERARAAEPAVSAAAADAERRWPALLVERKGRIAVTVHWRTAPQHAPDPAELADLARTHGLSVFPGRMACELRPSLAVDKGTAVADLLAELDVGAAAFAGDDRADLAAFDALGTWAAGASLGRPRTSLRIAVSSPEAPAELLTTADVVVAGPDALSAQLTALADAFR